VCHDFSDDTAGLTNADAALMRLECMTDYTGDDFQNQATVRGLHPGGVNIGLADDSAHFISSSIEARPQTVIGGNWPATLKLTAWDKFIASGEGGGLPQ
jgi:hypothetical protein